MSKVGPRLALVRTSLAFAGLACGMHEAPRAAAQPDIRAVVLPIVFHIATVDGEPVVPESFVHAQLEHANAIFEPYGIAFAKAGLRALAGSHAALETRSDRDAVGAKAERGAIDCFIVRSLRDVDDPSQMRRGVHWRSRSHPGVRFVIVSSIAGPNVLAHELGHYLGHPGHSDVAGNLMSYLPSDGLPVLDARQQRRLHRALQSYLRSGELKAVPVPKDRARVR